MDVEDCPVSRGIDGNDADHLQTVRCIRPRRFGHQSGALEKRLAAGQFS